MLFLRNFFFWYIFGLLLCAPQAHSAYASGNTDNLSITVHGLPASAGHHYDLNVWSQDRDLYWQATTSNGEISGQATSKKNQPKVDFILEKTDYWILQTVLHEKARVETSEDQESVQAEQKDPSVNVKHMVEQGKDFFSMSTDENTILGKIDLTRFYQKTPRFLSQVTGKKDLVETPLDVKSLVSSAKSRFSILDRKFGHISRPGFRRALLRKYDVEELGLLSETVTSQEKKIRSYLGDVDIGEKEDILNHYKKNVFDDGHKARDILDHWSVGSHTSLLPKSILYEDLGSLEFYRDKITDKIEELPKYYYDNKQWEQTIEIPTLAEGALQNPLLKVDAGLQKINDVFMDVDVRHDGARTQISADGENERFYLRQDQNSLLGYVTDKDYKSFKFFNFYQNQGRMTASSSFLKDTLYGAYQKGNVYLAHHDRKSGQYQYLTGGNSGGQSHLSLGTYAKYLYASLDENHFYLSQYDRGEQAYKNLNLAYKDHEGTVSINSSSEGISAFAQSSRYGASYANRETGRKDFINFIKNDNGRSIALATPHGKLDAISLRSGLSALFLTREDAPFLTGIYSRGREQRQINIFSDDKIYYGRYQNDQVLAYRYNKATRKLDAISFNPKSLFKGFESQQFLSMIDDARPSVNLSIVLPDQTSIKESFDTMMDQGIGGWADHLQSLSQYLDASFFRTGMEEVSAGIIPSKGMLKIDEPWTSDSEGHPALPSQGEALSSGIDSGHLLDLGKGLLTLKKDFDPIANKKSFVLQTSLLDKDIAQFSLEKYGDVLKGAGTIWDNQQFQFEKIQHDKEMLQGYLTLFGEELNGSLFFEKGKGLFKVYGKMNEKEFSYHEQSVNGETQRELLLTKSDGEKILLDNSEINDFIHGDLNGALDVLEREFGADLDFDFHWGTADENHLAFDSQERAFHAEMNGYRLVLDISRDGYVKFDSNDNRLHLQMDAPRNNTMPINIANYKNDFFALNLDHTNLRFDQLANVLSLNTDQSYIMKVHTAPLDDIKQIVQEDVDQIKNGEFDFTIAARDDAIRSVLEEIDFNPRELAKGRLKFSDPKWNNLLLSLAWDVGEFSLTDEDLIRIINADDSQQLYLFLEGMLDRNLEDALQQKERVLLYDMGMSILEPSTASNSFSGVDHLWAPSQVQFNESSSRRILGAENLFLGYDSGIIDVNVPVLDKYSRTALNMTSPADRYYAYFKDRLFDSSSFDVQIKGLAYAYRFYDDMLLSVRDGYQSPFSVNQFNPSLLSYDVRKKNTLGQDLNLTAAEKDFVPFRKTEIGYEGSFKEEDNSVVIPGIILGGSVKSPGEFWYTDVDLMPYVPLGLVNHEFEVEFQGIDGLKGPLDFYKPINYATDVRSGIHLDPFGQDVQLEIGKDINELIALRPSVTLLKNFKLGLEMEGKEFGDFQFLKYFSESKFLGFQSRFFWEQNLDNLTDIIGTSIERQVGAHRFDISTGLSSWDNAGIRETVEKYVSVGANLNKKVRLTSAIFLNDITQSTYFKNSCQFQIGGQADKLLAIDTLLGNGHDERSLDVSLRAQLNF